MNIFSRAFSKQPIATLAREPITLGECPKGALKTITARGVMGFVAATPAFPTYSVTLKTSFGEWDLKKLIYALQGLNRIAASARFKEEILKANCTETQDLTNEQVYEKLCSGNQLSADDEDGVNDFKAVMYRSRFSRVVGYTYLTSATIYFNSRFFGFPMSIASNVAHEVMHTHGFTHATTWSTSWPYTMNRIIEKLWAELCQDIDADFKAWWYS